MKLELSAGGALAALGVAMGTGALGFREDASYSGIGPAFYPGVIAAVLFVCGVMLIREAVTGGFRNLPEAEEGVPGHLRGFVLLSGGLLLTAFLITKIGFPLTCAMLFALVAYAFGSRNILPNLAGGLGISLLMHWAFSKGLGMSLPSLTAGGWI
jgi:putative tricarboxylic transport membrane protein